MTANFDLLGDPIPENFGKRGRPPHTPTQEKRTKIMLLQAMGWSETDMALELGITKTTMRKYYFRELRDRKAARLRFDSARYMVLFNQMREGNVAAAKELGRVVDKIDQVGAQRRFDDEQDGMPKVPLGKKAAAQEAAVTAGEDTGWGGDLLPDNGPTRH